MFSNKKISFGKISFDSTKQNTTNSAEKSVTSSGFGSFGNAKAVQLEDEKEENAELSTLIGFKSFGGKSSKDFDLEGIVEQSKNIAIERNKSNLEVLKKEEAIASDEENSSDDELIGPPLPPGLNLEENHPPLPPDLSEDINEDDDKEDLTNFPITCEMSLNHGSKVVSALAVDPAGSRLVSGSTDYDVRCWDFQGMDLGRDAFRTLRPCDGYPINSIEYSCTGDKFLVVSGSLKGKVYNRDAVEVYECAKGDMYLQDMAKTKGHICGLNDGAWHPKNKEEFLTCARDGTCRIWYTSRSAQQIYVIKPRGSGGLKTHPLSCSYTRDGLTVACACDDGSIQMWDHRKSFVNTCMNFKNAHIKSDAISSLTFSYDGKCFSTRGEDSVKLWDLRNNKSAVHVKNDLFSRFSMTDCLFSPSDQMIVTGTSMEKGADSGKLVFIDRNSFDTVKELNIGNNHVIRVVWNPRLNQIMLGCGDGNIRILYDPKKSRNGAILVAGKKKKRVKVEDVVNPIRQIITPHALPQFRDEKHRAQKQIYDKVRKDPKQSHQPDLPLVNAGTGGRVATGGSTLSAYIIKNLGIRNKVFEDENPREALLKFAKDSAENPYWITPAYSKTQPKTIFMESESKEEDNEEENKNKKMKTS